MFRNKLTKVARSFPPYRALVQMRDDLKAVRKELRFQGAMNAARAQEELLRRPRYEDLLRLPAHHFQVNSQNGEDGIIREIFRRVGTRGRDFVEIGVGNGAENNTAFLLAQGWEGYWIDADDAFLRVVAGRADLRLKTCVSFVERDTAAALFASLGVPAEFDLLSLDIDQNTYYLWEALGGYRPRVVVVEYNAGVPPDLDWKVRYAARRRWDGTQNFGASLKAFENLGRRLGYSLVGCDSNGVNCFFVREDLTDGKFAEPFTAENHYEPPRYEGVWRRGHPRAVLDRYDELTGEG